MDAFVRKRTSETESSVYQEEEAEVLRKKNNKAALVKANERLAEKIANLERQVAAFNAAAHNLSLSTSASQHESPAASEELARMEAPVSLLASPASSSVDSRTFIAATPDSQLESSTTHLETHAPRPDSFASSSMDSRSFIPATPESHLESPSSSSVDSRSFIPATPTSQLASSDESLASDHDSTVNHAPESTTAESSSAFSVDSGTTTSVEEDRDRRRLAGRDVKRLRLTGRDIGSLELEAPMDGDDHQQAYRFGDEIYRNLNFEESSTEASSQTTSSKVRSGTEYDIARAPAVELCRPGCTCCFEECICARVNAKKCICLNCTHRYTHSSGDS